MLSYRLGTVNAFHLKLNPVLSYSKPHTSQLCLEKKKKKNTFTLSNQANRKTFTKVP